MFFDLPALCGLNDAAAFPPSRRVVSHSILLSEINNKKLPFTLRMLSVCAYKCLLDSIIAADAYKRNETQRTYLTLHATTLDMTFEIKVL